MTHTSNDTPTGAVAVFALERRIRPAIVNYVRHLVEHGTTVHLVVVDDEHREVMREELGPEAPVVIHPLLRSERRLLVRRVENGLVFWLPGALADRAARPLHRRGQRATVARLDDQRVRLSRSAHVRGFLPIYRIIRPWLLARRWRSIEREVDLGSAARIVAADLGATTLVWRLAKRYPAAVATTALDRTPGTSAEPVA